MRLDALDEAAQALGLETGMPLAAARARVPELQVADADPQADLKLLTALAEACRRYTPALSLEPPDGVQLDITGVARVFGGERRLIDDLSARMARQGMTIRIGLARTPGLAWALARCGPPHAARSVRALPVTALRLEPDSLGVLHRLGLRRVGQILDIPRAALARRLGEGLLERLDEILGSRAPALDLLPEPLRFYAQHRLAEPIALETQVLGLCRWLAERLAERLDRRGVGGRVFVLELFRVDGARKRLWVQASRPLRDPARIVDLFTERLATLNDGLEADFGFDLLRLTAERIEPISLETRDFMGAADEGDFIALIDRLATRLGRGAVRRIAPAPESRIPERAVKSLPLNASAKAAWSHESPALYGQTLLRPLTLFSPPQAIEVIAGVPEDPPRRFDWRRRSHVVVRAEGPERIAREWWGDEEPEVVNANGGLKSKPQVQECGFPGEPQAAPDLSFRDYYRVEDDQGRRFWVFREGAFTARSRPRWFLHGLFP